LQRIEGVHAIGYAVQLCQQRRHPSGHGCSLGLAGEVIDGALDDGGLGETGRARQLFDLQYGSSAGKAAELMKAGSERVLQVTKHRRRTRVSS